MTVGTVGPVGERVFLLQVREGLIAEDAQGGEGTGVRAGAFPRPDARRARAARGAASGDELALEPFGEPDFVVRSLGVSYDDDLDRIILVADEIDRTEPEEEAEELFGLAEDMEPEAEKRTRAACGWR